jgi:hypothetical protein
MSFFKNGGPVTLHQAKTTPQSTASVAPGPSALAATPASPMPLDHAALEAAGVSPASASLLARQGVDTTATVAELDDTAWAHLYPSGLRISEAIALRAMAREATPQLKMPPPASASLPLNTAAIVLGIVFALPPLAIGVINEYGPFHGSRALDNTARFYVVFIPGVVYLIGSVVFIGRYRTIFSTDVLQQRSVDCSLREAIKGNLTSLGWRSSARCCSRS